MRTKTLSRLITTMLLVVMAGGCGTKKLVPVTGKVTLDGKALERGNVTFVPVKAGAPAVGAIQSDGKYTLNTGTDAGIAPGDYQVSVVATAPVVPPVVKPGSPPPPEVPPPLLTPGRYGRPETSGLKFTVPSSSGYDIAIKSQ